MTKVRYLIKILTKNFNKHFLLLATICLSPHEHQVVNKDTKKHLHIPLFYFHSWIFL